METFYEYAVIRSSDNPNDPAEGIHRGPWSKTKCEDWIAEGETDGFRKGAFLVVRRPVGAWEVTR